MNYARITVLLSKSKITQPVHGLHMVRRVLTSKTKVAATNSRITTLKGTLRYPVLLFVCLLLVAAFTETCNSYAKSHQLGQPNPHEVTELNYGGLPQNTPLPAPAKYY